MKNYILNLPHKRGLVIDFIIILAALLLILISVTISPEVEPVILSQSMLIVSGFSSLFASLFLETKKGNWWAKIVAEIKIAFIIMFANVLLAWITFTLFARIPSAGQATISQAQESANTYLFLIGSYGIYLFFRVFFILWRFLDRLRKQYFAWSLTYYFLVIVVVVIFAFLVLSTIFLSSAEIGPLGNVNENPWGLTLDWLVFTVVPVFGLFVIALFFCLMLLIPPFTLFSMFFARKLTSRLNNLGKATAALHLGDYQARSPVEGYDEIAQLQADFNTMAENLEKSVNELNKEKDIVKNLLDERKELIASVSHELRTPIATIMNYLDSVKGQIQAKRNPELKANIEVIIQETNRLNVIINDLFDLSRAEIGQLTINKERCNISEVIRKAVETQKPLAWKSRHVDLAYQVEKDLPEIMLDRDRLTQILSNLIRNSIEHTPPGGIVHVSAAQAEDSLVVSVIDTGEGISPEDLPNIWKRFYKGRNSGRGNGIGLSVVKELTELMGGAISVTSTVGTGSEFKVSFPVSR